MKDLNEKQKRQIEHNEIQAYIYNLKPKTMENYKEKGRIAGFKIFDIGRFHRAQNRMKLQIGAIIVLYLTMGIIVGSVLTNVGVF